MLVTLEVSKLSRWLNALAYWNMYCMFVTLEVSKLSGWLNADAYCRESNGGHMVRCEVQSTGRREATGDRGTSSVQERARFSVDWE